MPTTVPLTNTGRVILLAPTTVALGGECCCGACDVSVRCDQIGASASKCGFQDGSGPQFFLSAQCDSSQSDECGGVCEPCTTIGGPLPPGWCSSGLTCFNLFLTRYAGQGMGGSSTSTSSGTCDPSNCTFSGSHETSGESHGSLCCDSICFEDDRLKFNYPAGHDLGSTFHSGGSGYSCPCAHGPAEGCSQSLSNEYTTDLLISTAIGKLPDYDDDFDDFFGCFAARNLSEDESSYSLSRFKPKFVIPTARSTDLTFCYIETFQPADPDTDPTFTLKHATITAGETEVIGDEVREPSENGEVSISGGACACRATLSCDQISASKSKVGFGSFGGFPVPPGSFATNIFYSGTGCAPTVSCCGSEVSQCAFATGFVSGNSRWLTFTGTLSICHDARNFLNCGTTGCNGSCIGTYILATDPDTGVVTRSGSVAECCGTAPGTSGDTAFVSNEYTTAMLIDNTVASLPSYDDDFNDSCQAVRNLPDSEFSYTISRFKPKFTISSPLTFDFNIYYNEHFEPDDGEPVDTARQVTIPEGETEIIGDEVTEPDENGTITITDICCP